MSGEDKLRDIPINWEEIVTVSEPLKAVTPKGQFEEKEHQKGPKVDQTTGGTVINVGTSVEMQALNDSLKILEILSKREQWLRNQLESTLNQIKGERNELQTQLVKMIGEVKTSSRALNKKRKYNEEEGKKGEVRACKSCGKDHTGKCCWGTMVCYNCRQKGHFAQKCPKHKKIECYTCGAMNHLSKSCPENVNKKLKKNLVGVGS